MAESKAPRPPAVVTGASSGIGFNLAKIAAGQGCDLVVAGLKNKLDVAMSKVLPGQVVAQMQRRLAEPEGP